MTRRTAMIGLVLFICHPAGADEIRWENQSGGAWDDPANWINVDVVDDPGTSENEQHGVPTSTDDVVFQNGSTYAVIIGQADARDVTVHDTVSFAGGTLSCDSLFVFGELTVLGEVRADGVGVSIGRLVNNGRIAIGPTDTTGLSSGAIRILGPGVLNLSEGGRIEAQSLSGSGVVSSYGGMIDAADVELTAGFVFLGPTLLFCEMGTPCDHGLQVDGDLTIGPNVQVLCTLSPEYLAGETPMLAVDGAAEFHGTLRISAEPGVMLGTGSLVPGFRNPLVTFDSFEGRFDSFESLISGSAGFFGPMYTTTTLDIAIIAPLQIAIPVGPTTDGLIAVVPGLFGDPDAYLMQQFGTALQSQPTNGEWALASVAWSDFASNLIWAISASNRVQASQNAYEIGQAFAFEFASLTGALQRVHLVGTSGGVWLIDGFADRIRQLNPGLQINLTFLDAYGGTSSDLVIPGVGNWQQLGDNADWVEHYVDYRANWDGTNVRLPHAYNIDVAGLSGSCAVCSGLGCFMAAHLWPNQWYGQTITDPTSNEWGFARSWAWSGQFPSHNTYGPGQRIFLGPCQTGASGPPTWQSTVDLTTAVSQVTGTGTVNHPSPEAMNVTTPSQIDVELDLTLDQSADRLRMGLQFDAGDQGTATVSLDGQIVLAGDVETLAVFGVNGYAAADLEIPIIATAGAHQLRVVVDTPGGTPLSVTLSDVQFGVANPINELPADLDGDGQVGVADLLVLLGEWGCAAPVACTADVTGDGVVGIDDLLALLGAWSAA